MADRKTTVRAALRQQLMGDRLLGVRSAPTVAPVRAVSGERSGSPAGIASTAQPQPDIAASTDRADRLETLDRDLVRGCTKCGLAESRTQTVFGQGNPAARLVFVGEAPGFEEDKQGLAFIGRAGQLLTRMITAMGLSREDVFICNVLKCRPPGSRNPSAGEIVACSPYLREQLALIEPEVLVALGSPASKTLLGTAQSIGKLRGRFHEYHLSGEPGTGATIPLMPTYHPAYLLRNPADKTKTWADLKLVMELLGLPLPDKG